MIYIMILELELLYFLDFFIHLLSTLLAASATFYINLDGVLELKTIGG